MPHIMTKKAGKAAKVLVTGSHGLLGSAFIEVLKKRGIPYTAYDRTHPKAIKHDVTAVVHFGGVTPHSLVKGGVPSTKDYYAANVAGTATLLTALSHKENISRFVNIGSAAECGFSPRPFRESSICHPEGAYGQNKLEQSALVEEFARAHGVKTFNLRVFNLVGVADRSTGGKIVANRSNLFKALTNQFKKNSPRVIEVSNAKDMRDYVAVDDVLNAVLKALTANAGGMYELVNICSGRGTPISDVVTLFGKALHLPYTLKNLSRKTNRSIGVAGIADRLLKWHAKISLERAVRKYVEL